MIPLKDDNPTRRTPVLTYALIATCVLAHLWQLSLGQEGAKWAIYTLGTIPAALFETGSLEFQRGLEQIGALPPPATIVTSMFMHGGLMHLVGNMLYLWIFADNIEDRLGRGRFILFYFICGIIAVFAHALPNMSSQVPMVGASGAISGVLGAYLLLYPKAHVLVLIPLGFFSQVVHLPAMLVLGFWFVLQLLQSMAAGGGAGVAFGAHIGGFLAGMALLHLFLPSQSRSSRGLG